MAELKAKGTCDFCGEACNSDMRGAKAYDCEDFPMPMTGAMSYGAWGACPICAAFIDRENWLTLEEHMTEIHRRRFGFLAKLMLPKLRQMHRQADIAEAQSRDALATASTAEKAAVAARDSADAGTPVRRT